MAMIRPDRVAGLKRTEHALSETMVFLGRKIESMDLGVDKSKLYILGQQASEKVAKGLGDHIAALERNVGTPVLREAVVALDRSVAEVSAALRVLGDAIEAMGNDVDKDHLRFWNDFAMLELKGSLDLQIKFLDRDLDPGRFKAEKTFFEGVSPEVRGELQAYIRALGPRRLPSLDILALVAAQIEKNHSYEDLEMSSCFTNLASSCSEEDRARMAHALLTLNMKVAYPGKDSAIPSSRLQLGGVDEGYWRSDAAAENNILVSSVISALAKRTGCDENHLQLVTDWSGLQATLPKIIPGWRKPATVSEAVTMMHSYLQSGHMGPRLVLDLSELLHGQSPEAKKDYMDMLALQYGCIRRAMALGVPTAPLLEASTPALRDICQALLHEKSGPLRERETVLKDACRDIFACQDELSLLKKDMGLLHKEKARLQKEIIALTQKATTPVEELKEEVMEEAKEIVEEPQKLQALKKQLEMLQHQLTERQSVIKSAQTAFDQLKAATPEYAKLTEVQSQLKLYDVDAFFGEAKDVTPCAMYVDMALEGCPCVYHMGDSEGFELRDISRKYGLFPTIDEMADMFVQLNGAEKVFELFPPIPCDCPSLDTAIAELHGTRRVFHSRQGMASPEIGVLCSAVGKLAQGLDPVLARVASGEDPDHKQVVAATLQFVSRDLRRLGSELQSPHQFYTTFNHLMAHVAAFLTVCSDTDLAGLASPETLGAHVQRSYETPKTMVLANSGMASIWHSFLAATEGMKTPIQVGGYNCYFESTQLVEDLTKGNYINFRSLEASSADTFGGKQIQVFWADLHVNDGRRSRIENTGISDLLSRMQTAGKLAPDCKIIIDATLNVAQGEIDALITFCKGRGLTYSVADQSMIKYFQFGCDLKMGGLIIADTPSTGDRGSVRCAGMHRNALAFFNFLFTHVPDELQAYRTQIHANTARLFGKLDTHHPGLVSHSGGGSDREPFMQVSQQSDTDIPYIALNFEAFMKRCIPDFREDSWREFVVALQPVLVAAAEKMGLNWQVRDSFAFGSTTISDCIDTIRVAVGFLENDERLDKAYHVIVTVADVLSEKAYEVMGESQEMDFEEFKGTFLAQLPSVRESVLAAVANLNETD